MRCIKEKGSVQQKCLPTPPIEIPVSGIEISIGGFVYSIRGIGFSVPGIENTVPGFGKPVAATENPWPGNILLYAPPVRRAFDTRNRPPSTVLCQARIPKPPRYQEKCKFFEKISMKGLAVSYPCPTFALAKRNKAHRLPLSNAL